MESFIFSKVALTLFPTFSKNASLFLPTKLPTVAHLTLCHPLIYVFTLWFWEVIPYLLLSGFGKHVLYLVHFRVRNILINKLLDISEFFSWPISNTFLVIFCYLSFVENCSELAYKKANFLNILIQYLIFKYDIHFYIFN